MRRSFLFLVLVVGLLAFSSVSAFNIGGIEGRDSRNYTPGSELSYEGWPAQYKTACEQHMRAVIKRCAASGHENWTVSRMFSSVKFLPSQQNFSISDTVIGKQLCGYAENTTDYALST
ncbi:MAG: hypothetical protein HY917_02690, partial [Candidatus Diapherotrites archaeon]|nr:hypothetical protein [Candidatus Diapherotrites archaeon]